MEIDSSESTRSVVLELYKEVIIVVFVSGVDGGAGLEKVGEQWCGSGFVLAQIPSLWNFFQIVEETLNISTVYS